jgi:type I restriction enzyme S subunit
MIGKTLRLKECVDLLSGYPFKSKNFSNNSNDIPLVKGDNLHQGFIDWSNAKKWDKNDFENLKKFSLKRGDIVLAMDRPWLKNGLKYSWIKRNCPKECLLVQRVARMRADEKTISGAFLRYVIGSKAFEGYIKNIVTGVTVPHISGSQILNYKVTIPPLQTQKRIANILSAYDDLIENNQKRIAILEQMAQNLYKEWFVRFRFPNWQNVEFEKGIPKGWEMISLRDAVEFYIGGGWGKAEPDVKHNIGGFVIRGTDIPKLAKGKINREIYRYHSNSNINPRELKENDIVFEVSGGTQSQLLGRNIIISKEILNRFNDKIICASFCKLIRPNENLNSNYLKCYFDHIIDNEHIAQYQVQSTGICNFQFEAFLDYELILKPSQEILDKFNLVSSNLRNQIDKLGNINDGLKQQRNKLLPRLLSGKLEV